MKLIKLTKGFVAQVDDEDYEKCIKHSWSLKPTNNNVFYAQAKINNLIVYLHKFVLNIVDDILIDHKDRDGLNCQKSNLRVATRSQNMANRLSKKKYKGVTQKWYNDSLGNRIYYNAWIAQCNKDGKPYRIQKSTEIEAAIAYNEMALKLHGEFARLNIID